MKKSRTIRRAFFFGALSAALLLGGCSAREEERTELTLIHGWGSTEPDHAAMRQIYRDFEKENPGVHINLISMPSSADVINKTQELLTVGQIPDLIFTGGESRETVYRFMEEKGYAVDLIPYMEKDSAFRESVSDAILDYWLTDDGRLYTVSDVALVCGYWYNEELFEKAGIEKIPSTWEEFYEACRRLSETAPPMLLDADHLVYLTDAAAADLGENAMKKIWESNPDPYLFRILEKLEQIAQYSEITGTYSFRDALSRFNQGKTAIYINGIWASSMIDPQLRVSYAPFPSETGQATFARSSCVGYIAGNTGDKARMDASVSFIKYMLSKPVAERILKETGQLPQNPGIVVQEQEAAERFLDAALRAEEAERFIEVPANQWSADQIKTYGQNVTSYLNGTLSYAGLKQELYQKEE